MTEDLHSPAEQGYLNTTAISLGTNVFWAKDVSGTLYGRVECNQGLIYDYPTVPRRYGGGASFQVCFELMCKIKAHCILFY